MSKSHLTPEVKAKILADMRFSKREFEVSDVRLWISKDPGLRPAKILASTSTTAPKKVLAKPFHYGEGLAIEQSLKFSKNL